MSRIVAGSRGGRRIATPPGSGTRPTTDRVREALFSAVAAWAGTAAEPPERTLAGLSFCDLYAGSGAVGLEAASRGAAPVLLVEADRRTAELAARNAAGLDLRVETVTGRVEQVAARPSTRSYDVVFADPPYEQASELLDALLVRLQQRGWVGSGSLFVLERSRRSTAPDWPPAVLQPWQRTYGETVLHFGMVEADA